MNPSPFLEKPRVNGSLLSKIRVEESRSKKPHYEQCGFFVFEFKVCTRKK